MRTALFWVLTQRVVVIFFPKFWGDLSVPTSRVKNPPKKSRLSQYGLHIGNNGDGDKFSVEWCQLVGLKQAVRREGELDSRSLKLGPIGCPETSVRN